MTLKSLIKNKIKFTKRQFKARYSKPVVATVLQDATSARITFGKNEIYFRGRSLSPQTQLMADFALDTLTMLALTRGINFRLDAPVRRSAYEKAQRLGVLWRVTDPMRMTPAQVECPQIIEDEPIQATAPSIMCLSGGFDSTFCMVKHAADFPEAMLIKGADYPAEGPSAFAELVERTTKIAEYGGMRLTVVETNLRKYLKDWGMFHTMALIACLRFYTNGVGSVAYAADFRPYQDGLYYPWGNNTAVPDALTSELFRINHLEPKRYRTEKVVHLATEHPALLPHLTTCFATTASTNNCGTCAKCLSVRLAIQAIPDVAARENAEIHLFGAIAPPIEHVRRLRPQKNERANRYLVTRLDDLIQNLPPGELRAAMQSKLVEITDWRARRV